MKRVYFIRAADMPGSMVKIGTSIAPESRRRNFQVWSPFPLEVAAEIEGGLKLEARFHALFQEQLFEGEWFRPSAELDATIDAIRAGTFDISTLPDPIDLRRLKGNYPTGPLSEEERAHRAALRAHRTQWIASRSARA